MYCSNLSRSKRGLVNAGTLGFEIQPAGVLFVVGAPGQLPSLAGQEHGPIITLASFRDHQLLHCETLTR
jgi:hypothetical protein